MIKIGILIGLICFAVNGIYAENSVSGEFNYKRISDNKIEFQTGNEVFLFNVNGGRYQGLNFSGMASHDSFLTGMVYRGKNKEPGFLWMRGIKNVEILLDNDITKKLKVTLEVSKYIENPDSFTPMPFWEMEIIFQIYKNIPAISIQSNVRNLSEDKFDLHLLWQSNYTPDFFSILPKKQTEPETKANPKSEGWTGFLRQPVFLHAQEKQKGLGVVIKNGYLVFTPFVYICSNKYSEIAPGGKSGQFEIIYMSIKEGYKEIDDINRKIEMLTQFTGEN